jgi:hypothetical protein
MGERNHKAGQNTPRVVPPTEEEEEDGYPITMYTVIQIHSFHHPIKLITQFIPAVTSILPTVSSSYTRWQLISKL